MPTLLASADLVVLPSRTEGLPLAVLEAMAAGRPVVATDVGGVREAVRHGENGLLVPARAPEQLAAAVAAVLADPAQAGSMGVYGREMARASFRAESMVRLLEETYEEWWAQLGLPRAGREVTAA
jgi:glycosyltransferase involved in cell wall biosynthesis